MELRPHFLARVLFRLFPDLRRVHEEVEAAAELVDFGFGEDVQEVLWKAREEAVGFGHDFLGTEHILLALLKAEGARGRRILNAAGLEDQRIREQLARHLRPPGPSHEVRELPFERSAKKVLEIAMDEAGDLDHTRVTSGHLLLGLLLERRGAAGRVLRSLRLDLGRVRRASGEGSEIGAP